jgi:hypothetical protein
MLVSSALGSSLISFTSSLVVAVRGSFGFLFIVPPAGLSVSKAESLVSLLPPLDLLIGDTLLVAGWYSKFPVSLEGDSDMSLFDEISLFASSILDTPESKLLLSVSDDGEYIEMSLFTRFSGRLSSGSSVFWPSRLASLFVLTS